MSMTEVIQSSSAGLLIATKELKRTVDALENGFQDPSDTETLSQTLESLSLDVRDAYKVFDAAFHFYDVARNT